MGKQDLQIYDQICLGDSLDCLRQLPEGIADLVVTSPPYAANRKKPYTGCTNRTICGMVYAVHRRTVEGTETRWVLRAEYQGTGSQRRAANLCPRIDIGNEKTRLVLDRRIHLAQERIAIPGKWSNRFRDAWERCLHFTKDKHFRMYQDEVMVPVGKWADSRLRQLSETDKRRDESKVGSGFGKNISNWLDRDMVYPSNVFAPSDRKRQQRA